MEKNEKFYRLGIFIYKFRWPIILLWLIIVIACMPSLPHITTTFKNTGFVDTNSESTKADDYLNKKLGYNNNRIIIIYHSKTLLTSHPLYHQEIKKSLSGLKNFPLQHEIIFPSENKKQISKDKHTAYAVVLFKSNEPINHDLLTKFQYSIKKPLNMTMRLGGEPIFVESVNKQTQVDLYKADLIAAPVSIITLILVFGSLVAAVIPLVLGGACAIIILTTLYAVAHFFSLSIFTLNIALLLGLCLSLDYSLFIIYRFRSELRHGLSIREAIAVTQSTAGKAVFFSGLAVFISLSALLLFPINILFSVGVGGLSAVLFAVLISIILLPAILSVLNHRIDLLSIKVFKSENGKPIYFWNWLATKVIAYPKSFFIFILIFLSLLGYPFLEAKFGLSDFHILPKQSESRKFFDIYQDKFNENQLTPIFILVKTQEGKILSKQNISKLYDYSHKIKENNSVYQVNSIVNIDANLNKKQYQMLYSQNEKDQHADIKKLLKTTTLHDMSVMTVISKFHGDSEQTKQLVQDLHLSKPGKGMSVMLTGTPVSNIEVLNTIHRIFPYAILWIMVFTYLILLVLLRSLFLPLKAILMNIFSLCASYGVLVFIIQEGHFSQWLNFEPQGMLDISLLIIIFCALFGFSMDYEVFLLSRIKEFYEKTGDNDKSIVFGIEQSSRIITSAAIIVILICFSFMVADVLMVKAFGLGIAVAIFVDAFLIRTILVPATMTLVKQWNWYLPKWLDKILPR